MHLVRPVAEVSGFTIEEIVEAAAEPGPLRLTRPEEVVEEHIFALRWVVVVIRLDVALVGALD